MVSVLRRYTSHLTCFFHADAILIVVSRRSSNQTWLLQLQTNFPPTRLAVEMHYELHVLLFCHQCNKSPINYPLSYFLDCKTTRKWLNTLLHDNGGGYLFTEIAQNALHINFRTMKSFSRFKNHFQFSLSSVYDSNLLFNFNFHLIIWIWMNQ